MKRSNTWAWASRAELDPAIECNEVWINPHLPSPERQSLQPLRVEISVLECFPRAFDQIKRFFATDSVLAAIVRRYDTCHFLIYTSIADVSAYDRCRDVRDALGVTSFGYSIATDATWASLVGLDDDTLPASGTPWVALGAAGGTDEG